MVEPLEKNFPSLRLSLDGLRLHYDLNAGRIVVPSELRDRIEIQKDLEAAVAAARRGPDPHLSGEDVIAEVHDEDSPHHRRSAFQIFSRAASYDALLSKHQGLFPVCSVVRGLEDLSVSIRPLRDYHFQKGSPRTLAGVFPETVADRNFFGANLMRVLEVARQDGEADVLTGWEVGRTFGFNCRENLTLEIFWQAAVASAAIEGVKDLSAITPGPILPSPPPSVGVPPPAAKPLPYPIPTAPAPAPASPPSPDLELALDFAAGTADIALAGTGVALQRGAVDIFEMTFVPADEGGKKVLRLTQVDRRPPQNTVADADRTPWGPEEFKHRHGKIYRQGVKEAEILHQRNPSSAEPIVSSIKRKGWIKGVFNFRRFAGLFATAMGGIDLVTRIFRRDGRGLDGPLTDAGMSPLGSRLALVGAGVAGLGAIILTGGLAAPVVAGLATISTVGLMIETQETFNEANEELDRKFEAWDSQKPPPKPADLIFNHRFVA